MYRTRNGGELRKRDAGSVVTIAGWVRVRRDHGGLIFLDIRDASGVLQVRFDPKSDKEAWSAADRCRSEFVVTVTGTVILRPKDMVNDKLPTGEIEVAGTALEVLNEAKTSPFPLTGDVNVKEDIRLTYRYLDLRRDSVRQKLLFRAKFVTFIRAFLVAEGFTEIETPILGKSTPEGARDYLVPSRLYPGKFYALPQSPQQYKQLLMVGGFEKYFQIAPCFRDEDGRADRAPDQFSQLDLEMAFTDQEEVLALIERLFTGFVEEHMEKHLLTKPWPRLTYAEAMGRFGTDKPDLRFGVELTEVTAIAKGSEFEVFANAPIVKAIVAPNGASFSRKVFDELTDIAKAEGARGLAYAKVEKGKLDSPIAKFIGKKVVAELLRTLHAGDGDALFFVADTASIANRALGAVRTEIGKRLNLADPNALAFCFVVDFPLFEEEKVDGHFAPMHHMFTRPKEEDLALLATDPAKVRSWQHDLVLNGTEVAGGSLRIYTRALQEKIFQLIGFTETQRQEFQHMLTAFEFGAPPHGGIAPGIDRLVMLMLDEPNVREVVAFPKSGDNRDLTFGAPSAVTEGQLKDLHLKNSS